MYMKVQRAENDKGWYKKYIKGKVSHPTNNQNILKANYNQVIQKNKQANELLSLSDCAIKIREICVRTNIQSMIPIPEKLITTADHFDILTLPRHIIYNLF